MWNRVDIEISLLNYSFKKRVDISNYSGHPNFFQFAASKLKLTFLHLEAEVALACFLPLFFLSSSFPLLSYLFRKSSILAEIEWIGFFSSVWRYWVSWEFSFGKLQGQMKEMAESHNITCVSIIRVELTEWHLRYWTAQGWGVGERLLGVKVQVDWVS